jgi:putative flavoprotein involved in K+ transport
MPEVAFAVRWADGTGSVMRSPSRAIERFLVAGAVYPRDEFMRRVTDGMAAASERVRERYGVACTAAAEQTVLAGELAAAHGIEPGAPVTVESMRRLDRVGGERLAQGPLPDHVEVAIVGGGQAGLSTSWFLSRDGVDHVVLERDRVASGWRHGRWDNFCLVTPNFQCRLPDFPYPGPEPDGFMPRDEIIAYVESFAASFAPPLHEGVTVTRVARAARGGFTVATDHGELHADQVVLCVGGYHRPRLPGLAEQLPASVTQLHSSTYRNASSVPDGGVLVVGSGQSGAQIAEDLLFDGREVHLAVGSAPRCSRRYRGRDCIAWLEDIGHYDMPVDQHKAGIAAARHEPNHYMTGRGWDHDIDLRAHAQAGMRLHGRLDGVADDGGTLLFRGDLGANLDSADATAERIKDTIDAYIGREGIDAPAEDRYVAVWQPGGDGSAPLDLAAADVNTIVWATGFAADWSWVDVDGFLDETGYPRYTRGICDAEGLSVLGLPWLYTWGSGRFAGIARDAEHVAAEVTRRAGIAARETVSG